MNYDLSIIVPAYNEGHRIQEGLAQIVAWAEQQSETVEIIVVDDGSTDDTGPRAAEVAADAARPLRVLVNDGNRGKGYSVRRGLAEGQGKWLLFSDADLSAPISEANKLLDPLRADEIDVAVGSRGLDRSVIQKSQALPRDLLGRCFNLAVRSLTRISIYDTQCGFKAFRAEAVQSLLPHLRVDRFGFDVELLAACQARGLRLREIPVQWSHMEGSTVNVLRDGVGMLGDLLRISRRIRRGDFSEPR